MLDPALQCCRRLIYPFRVSYSGGRSTARAS